MPSADEMIWHLDAERVRATSEAVTSPCAGGKLFLVSGKRHKNRDEFREPLTGTAWLRNRGEQSWLARYASYAPA
jgi:hypothetical protein